MKKIYIAGKITGDPNYRAKFKETEERLKANGHIVLNPAELPEGMNSEDYMRICLAMMESADAALFLSDYKDSKGAMIEYNLCKYTKKPTYYREIDTERSVNREQD